MKTAMQEVQEQLQSGELDPLKFMMWFSGNMWRLLEKEKQQTIDFSISAYQDISRMKGVSENLISENKILFEEYYNKTYNPKKEELLSLLVKQAQELDLGYEEFELGGEG